MDKINQIYIYYLNNPQEIFNRKSAIGSYVSTLKSCLGSEVAQVEINKGIDILKTNGDAIYATQNNSFKRLMPTIIKKYILQTSKLLKLLFNERKISIVLKSKKNFLVIDFYTAYSNIGRSINNYGKYIILYDAPIEDEYKFFNKIRIPYFRLFKSNEAKALLRADFIIVYSPAVKNFLVQKHPKLSKSKFLYHHNVDFSRLDFEVKTFDKNKPINFGFIGSFLKWHRVDLLVKVFETLLDEGLNANLYLVGDGQEYDNITKMVDQSKYKSKVFVTGFLDGKDLLQIKRKIDIGIMPSSNWYGAPNKLFEYGAMGLACIAPSTPTVEYVFKDREHLLLFKNNDFESLKSCMYELATNIGLKENLGQNLFNYIKFNFNKKKTIDFYSNLLNWEE